MAWDWENFRYLNSFESINSYSFYGYWLALLQVQKLIFHSNFCCLPYLQEVNKSSCHLPALTVVMRYTRIRLTSMHPSKYTYPLISSLETKNGVVVCVIHQKKRNTKSNLFLVLHTRPIELLYKMIYGGHNFDCKWYAWIDAKRTVLVSSYSEGIESQIYKKKHILYSHQRRKNRIVFAQIAKPIHFESEGSALTVYLHSQL